MVFDAARRPAGRGAYDRHQPAVDRAVQQRDWILLVTAQVLHERESPTVSRIIRRAGLGRNTFYVHFSNCDDAIDAVMHAALQNLETTLDAHDETERTPRERIQGFAMRWCGGVRSAGDATWALLNGSGGESALRHQRALRLLLSTQLQSCAEAGQRAGMFGRDNSEMRVDAAVGAVEAVGRRLVEQPDSDADEQGRALADTLLRILR